jgi:hypothetical protein
MSTPQKSPVLPAVLAVGCVGLILVLAYALLSGPGAVSPRDDPGADASEPDSAVAAPDAADDPWFLVDKIAFRPVVVDAKALEAARGRGRGKLDEPLDFTPVERALDPLGRAERTGADPATQREAQQRFSVHVSQTYARGGAPGAQALEAALWTRFRAALEAVSAGAKAQGKTVEELGPTVGTELDGPLDRVGSFLTLGRQIGLMDRWGAVQEQDWPVVRLAFRIRFFASFAGAVSPDELLAAEEVRTFYLWRLHNAPVTDAGLRTRWANRMSARVDGYPSSIALVVVLVGDGKTEQARQALELAREQHPERAGLLEAWATLLPTQETAP